MSQLTMPTLRARAFAAWLMILLAGVLSCSGGGDATGPGATGGVSSVEITQRTLTVGVGSSVVLQALARDASGRPLTDRTIVWTSSDTTIARVSAAGVVTALREGDATIAATAEGKSAVVARSKV